MSESFRVGEIVDITIKGARVEAYNSAYLTITTPNATKIAFECGDPHVTVERVAPAEWPPQIGDLWRDREGTVWFTVDRANYDHDSERVIVMVSPGEYEHGGDRTPDDLNRAYGPLTLVHREVTP